MADGQDEVAPARIVAVGPVPRHHRLELPGLFAAHLRHEIAMTTSNSISVKALSFRRFIACPGATSAR
jgi:hypothetical protein